MKQTRKPHAVRIMPITLPSGKVRVYLYDPKTGRRKPASTDLWPAAVAGHVRHLARQLRRAGDRVSFAEG